jgi:hypothetical protein
MKTRQQTLFWMALSLCSHTPDPAVPLHHTRYVEYAFEAQLACQLAECPPHKITMGVLEMSKF